ncbi:MAG: glycosyltransferase family 2 protein [Candidatus Omnitrophica bacterium]|nr:glycosyltransferase family 2 protein [Candidatus Omnitrophota bacterium]
MENFPYLSVVIPVFNEEGTIAETLRRLRAFFSLKDYPWECLVVSDGSTDRTCERAREAIAALSAGAPSNFRLLSNAKNRGKGAAARQGMLAASGRYILLTDVDLSSPIKEADKLVLALEEGSDIAIGSRALRAPGADVRQSLRRRISGRLFNLAVRTLLLRDFQDTQCGFKCFRKEAAHRLFTLQTLDGFSFDVEVLYLAVKNGMQVKEVPVMWSQGQDTKVKFLRDSYRMVRDLFFLRRKYLRKRRFVV